MNVFALDFDGVLCDSAAETAVSAWRAGRGLWPEWQGDEPAAEDLERFCRLRCVIETGYQTVPLMWLIRQGLTDTEILANFEGLCDGVLKRVGKSRAEMVSAFGTTRDEWIATDAADWLARHRFYPGTAAAVREALARDQVFILTTKQKRFTMALLAAHNVPLGSDRVFGLEDGRPKARVLADLLRRPELEGGVWHFVEDRLGTLLRVLAEPVLDGVRLYLAAWGYNTAAERARAAHQPRIGLWRLDEFLRVQGAVKGAESRVSPG